MTLIKLTIDTSSLIDWLDQKGVHLEVGKIMQLHDQGLVEARVSSRVTNVDIKRMDPNGRQTLEQKLSAHGIQITPSSFRFDTSEQNGPDVFNGPSERSEEELKHFEQIVGKDPTSLPKGSVGGNLSNKIADYDALRDHYAMKRDVFITNEVGDYFPKKHRLKYKEKLGLVIQDPKEFVQSFTKNQQSNI